jgi:thiamine biosynthesis lipoprotein
MRVSVHRFRRGKAAGAGTKKPRRMASFLLLCGVSLLFATALGSCSPKKESLYRKTMILMDTLVTIHVVADNEESADKAMTKAFEEIGRLDTLLNFFSDKSELSSINRNAGISGVRVSPETFEVIEKAVFASERSGGAFDVTIGPEISLWNFFTKKKPDDRTVSGKLGLVNYRMIVLNRGNSTVELRKKGMLMDLGAIAKGFGADKAVEALKRQGIRSGLVAVAGDIKAFGVKQDGKPWRVGIRNPRQSGKDDEILATIEIRDMAISTSGDYERFFILDGERYHHILDPRTGYPARNCQSVTVMAKDGVSSDSFSTAVFVLTPDKGMALLQQLGFEGLIVDNQGKIYVTPGIRDKVEFTRNR